MTLSMSMTNKTMRVQEVMLLPNQFPSMPANTLFKIALEQMGDYRLGIACLTDNNLKLLGILTDGDIRRRLLYDQRPFSAFFVDDAIDHAITDPVTISPESSLTTAVDLMEKFQIWDLPVISHDGTLLGLLHLHSAVKSLLEVS